MKVGDMMGKLFSAAMFSPEGELAVEVDGKVYRLTGDLRTEGEKIIFQVNQDDVEKPSPRNAPRNGPGIVTHAEPRFVDRGEQTNWQIPRP